MPSAVIPFSLKEAPALIETLLPVQRLSVDIYKERMAGSGQTLTALGSYWKGRKPLVLGRACVLGALLPATENPKEDLEIFELLMGMDDLSVSKRRGLPSPKLAVETLEIEDIEEYVRVTPEGQLPMSAPFLIADYPYKDKHGFAKYAKVLWRSDVNPDELHRLCLPLLPKESYKERIGNAKRAEEIFDNLHTHIWSRVNQHLGTEASSFPELVEQLGIMRFGHRPRVADTFCGSGQIPFEAARLGCDVYASDLNPVACMLTWGAFNIVGASAEEREQIDDEQVALAAKVKGEIDALGIETDGNGWRGKVYLYCLEVTCPTSGWKVPVLPTLVVSKWKRIIAKLLPDPGKKRYDIEIVSDVSLSELVKAEKGTYQNQSIVHSVDGFEHRNKISSIRGDYTDIVSGKSMKQNRLRQWGVSDIVFRDDDIFNERLYAIQWIKDDATSRPETEFRSVIPGDLEREAKVTAYVQEYLAEWQEKGWIPDMRIETGYNTDQTIRERGWTHWQHLFNPRQLLLGGMFNRFSNPALKIGLARILNANSRLSRWDPASGGGGCVQAVFDNQALNTLFNYGCRSFVNASDLLVRSLKQFPVSPDCSVDIDSISADQIQSDNHIYITDPPYGDAVKYEEILEFFIAWLRKNPPAEFSDWIWDSRRKLAIKGEDHDFKISMINAYKRMAEYMPDNGLQIIMFTHQSGSIWADMANIVWASGLRVTAAWYVVTETESALRGGQYVKGTILLVLRKRADNLDGARDEIAYELIDEVERQVLFLTGLNENAKALYREENLFEDADIQMAGYAAALRVLTRYASINGVDMAQEALRPRVKGQKTMVDELIEFAVDLANQHLVPQGLSREVWNDLSNTERFYLKMVDMESRGVHVLSNYQNFAKAFKVADFSELIGDTKANETALKTAKMFGKRGMSSSDAFGLTATRSILYAIFLLLENKLSSDDILNQFRQLALEYYQKRDKLISLADYLSKKTAGIREEESRCAMILRDLIRNDGTC